jgi:hypothetical protein
MHIKIFSKIYKKIIFFFIFRLYGRILTTQNKLNKNLFTKKKSYNGNNYKFFEIKDGRLYTNTSDVAYISNNIIISGPSIQLRENFNKNVNQNITVKNGTPKFYKKINFRVFSLLCGVDANNNYYHWFFDSISKYFIFKKFYKFTNNDFFLTPNLKYNYQIQSLKMLNIKNAINSYNLKHFKVKKLISLNFKHININHPDWIVKEMRSSFIPKKYSNKQSLKIFINRGGISSDARDISNKEELIFFLKNQNFLIIDPSKYSFKDEIKLFNSAKIVVGIYGAALTNVIFCQKKTHIIELKNNKTDALYKNITNKSSLYYHSLISAKINSNSSRRAFDGSIHVDMSKLSKILSKIN